MGDFIESHSFFRKRFYEFILTIRRISVFSSLFSMSLAKRVVKILLEFTAGHGNNPYHFDPSNPSPGTKAMIATKRSDRIIFEKYWGLHHDGIFFNVIHLNDLHYEKCETGVAEYWTLNDKGWIDTSLDPFPENTRIFTMDTTTTTKPPKPPKK